MTFLLLSVPLMLVAITIAALPLLILSVREHRLVQAEVLAARSTEQRHMG